MTEPVNKQGYVFLNYDQVYSVGDIYCHDTKDSRWFCVDEYIHKVFLKWPGNLYRVEIIDFVSADEPPKLTKNPGYARALSFRIIEVMPVAKLFGAYGEDICSILDWIQSAELADFEKIENLITEEMKNIYSRAWIEWLKGVDPESYHLDYPHYDTIGIPTNRQNPDSPINKGFYLIADLFEKKVNSLVGDDMWIFYVPDSDDNFEEDDDPRRLSPFWKNAYYALLYAAMGFGVKNLLKKDECDLLLGAWNKR